MGRFEVNVSRNANTNQLADSGISGCCEACPTRAAFFTIFERDKEVHGAAQYALKD